MAGNEHAYIFNDQLVHRSGSLFFLIDVRTRRNAVNGNTCHLEFTRLVDSDLGRQAYGQTDKPAGIVPMPAWVPAAIVRRSVH